MRGAAKVTLPQAYCNNVPRVNTHCFYTSAFSTSCFVLSAMNGRTEQRVCSKLCLKPEILAMLSDDFWRIFFMPVSGF
jgi:hypothetical protein